MTHGHRVGAGAESSKVLGSIPGSKLMVRGASRLTCLLRWIKKWKQQRCSAAGVSWETLEALPKESLLQLEEWKKPNGSQILTCFQTCPANFLHSSCHLPFHVTERNFPVSCWAVTEQTERLADQMTSLRHRYALWPTALGQLRGYIRTPGSTASVRRITLRQSKESDCEMSSAAGPITHSTSFLWGIQ